MGWIRGPMARAHRTALIMTGLALTVVAGVGAAAAFDGIARPWLDEVRPAQRTLCAELADTVGLYEGNSVTMLGVEIGNVTEIRAEGDRMRVAMSIDRSVRLPADAEAVTMSSSIVTDRHLELTKPYRGGPTFDAAHCIPLERTRTPVGISDALDAVGKLSGDLLGQQGAAPAPGGTPDAVVEQTLTAADAAVSGTGQQWNLLLQKISQIVGDPADRDTTFRKLVDNLDILTTMFVGNWPDMQAVLDNLHDGIQMIDGVSTHLARMVDLAVELLPVIVRNVEKYDKRAYELLDQFLPHVKVYAGMAGDIADILMHLPPIAERLPGATPEGGGLR